MKFFRIRVRDLIFFTEASDACAAENSFLEFYEAHMFQYGPLTERSLSIEAMKPAEYERMKQRGIVLQ